MPEGAGVKKSKIDPDFDYSKVKGSTEMHNKFKREFMICASAKFLGISIIPYDVSVVRALSQPEVIYQVGQVGVLDTIVFGAGFYCLLDMKTGKNQFSPEQRNYVKRLEEINGKPVAFKIKSVNQGLGIIKSFYAK